MTKHSSNNNSKQLLILGILILVSTLIVSAVFLYNQNQQRNFVLRQEENEKKEKEELYSKKQECSKSIDNVKNKVSAENREQEEFSEIVYGNTWDLGYIEYKYIFYSEDELSCLYVVEYGKFDNVSDYEIRDTFTDSVIKSFSIPSQEQEFKEYINKTSNGQIKL